MVHEKAEKDEVSVMITEKLSSPDQLPRRRNWGGCFHRLVTTINLALVILLFLGFVFYIQNHGYFDRKWRNNGLPRNETNTKSLGKPVSEALVNAQDRSSRLRHRRNRENIQALRDCIDRWLIPPTTTMRGYKGDGGAYTFLAPATGNLGLDHICARRKCFRWSQCEDMNCARDFEYFLDNGNSSQVVGVKIKTPGRYWVYSQVGVRGPYKGNPYHEEHVALNIYALRSGSHRLLAGSYLTQDGRGRYYINPRGNSHTSFPEDSLSYVGLHELKCDDILYVTPGINDGNVVYTLHKDFTSFGIVFQSPTSLTNRPCGGDFICP